MSTTGVHTTSEPYDATIQFTALTIGTAFSVLPLTQYLVPLDAPDRDRILREYYKLQVRQILTGETGYVDVVEAAGRSRSGSASTRPRTPNRRRSTCYVLS
ncbi:MAG TPA: hypothetical protein VNO31_09195 [Umezawaea sp.]|nr:hypothetical protein [Umezawaea sp.]